MAWVRLVDAGMMLESYSNFQHLPLVHTDYPLLWMLGRKILAILALDIIYDSILSVCRGPKRFMDWGSQELSKGPFALTPWDWVCCLHPTRAGGYFGQTVSGHLLGVPGQQTKSHTGKGGKLNTSQAEPLAANSRAVGQFLSISVRSLSY